MCTGAWNTSNNWILSGNLKLTSTQWDQTESDILPRVDDLCMQRLQPGWWEEALTSFQPERGISVERLRSALDQRVITVRRPLVAQSCTTGGFRTSVSVHLLMIVDHIQIKNLINFSFSCYSTHRHCWHIIFFKGAVCHFGEEIQTVGFIMKS